MQGIDGDAKRNVLALLSLERYKDRERIEPEAVTRLYNRIDDEVRTALRPYGFYEPKIDASISGPDKDRRWRVKITIDPGTPILIETVNVKIDGPGAEDEVFKRILEQPPLHEGDQLSHAAYDSYKGSLERAAATYGYLDARMLHNEMRVDRERHRAQITIELDTGQRYYFGKTTIEQNSVRENVVQRFLRYREGDPYNALELLRTQFALDDSQYYSTVEVDPGDRDTVHHTVPITIRANNARRGYSIGVGYGTDTGARGTASWTVPRVNSLGHRFRVEMQLSQIQQTFDARYEIPFGDPALEKFSLDAVGQQDQFGNNVTSSDIAFTPSVTQIIGGWQRVLSASFAHTITTDAVEGRAVDNLVVPSIVYATVPEGYLGEALFSRGLYAQLQGSTTQLGARENFLRLDLQAERVVDINPVWHLLLRSEFGAATVKDVENLPALYRFFAGGDRSVRGFSYDDLSPVTIITDKATGKKLAVKVGGRELITGTTEIERDLPHNFGIALFSDAGNAIDHLNDSLALSVGIGFRLRLPVVTVGIDVAQSLRAPGYPGVPGPRLHLNISPKL